MTGTLHEDQYTFLITSLSVQWRTEGGWDVQTPPPRNSEGPPKSSQTHPDCENC